MSIEEQCRWNWHMYVCMYVCMYLLITYYICPIHRPHNHQPVCPDNYTQPKFQLYVYGYKVYSLLQLMIYFFVDLYIQNQIFFQKDREWIYFRVVITYSSSTPWCQPSLVLFLWVSSKKLKLLITLGCGLYELKLFQLSIASCKHLQPDICRSTLSRKKKTFYLTYRYFNLGLQTVCDYNLYHLLPTYP
jgi:hypothetical protein